MIITSCVLASPVSDEIVSESTESTELWVFVLTRMPMKSTLSLLSSWLSIMLMIFPLPLSEESEVGSEVSMGLESPLDCFGGEVLLSLSSELSVWEPASTQWFRSFCSLPTCWSLYINAIS